MNIEKQLKLSIDYSKVAVGILSNDSEEYDFKMALDKQLNKPKQFIEEIHEDDFGLSYITRKTGPGAYLELKKKWTQVEFLITCIYFDESVHGEPPSAQDFHLYKVEKMTIRLKNLLKLMYTF